MKHLYPIAAIAVALLTSTQADAQRNLASPDRGTVRTHAPQQTPTTRGGGAPANDECTAAELITIVPVANCATSMTTGNNGSSTISTGDPNCDFSAAGYQDVWYTFNSGSYTSVHVSLENIDGTDYAFTVQPTCDPGSEIACVLNPLAPAAVGLTANTDYYIRVYANADYGEGGEFTLCVSYSGSGTAPANDDCANAVNTNITLGAPAQTLSGNNTGATEDGGSGYAMVWHRITLIQPGDIHVSYCVPGSVFDNYLINLATQCPDILTNMITGFYDTCSVTFECIMPGSYLIPVLVDTSDTPDGAYSIQVSTSACAPPPSNNECESAISLTPANTCIPVAGTTTGATVNMGPIDCNHTTSPNANDVWYSFVATSESDSIIVEGIGEFDGVIEFFSGGCGNLVSITCEDSTFPFGSPATERMFVTDLSIGTTYFIRLYDYGHLAQGHAFNICVTVAGPIGIDEVSAPTFSLYPNPTEGDITISGADLSGKVLIEMTDMTGRVVYTRQETMAADQGVTLPLSGLLAQGSYLLRLTTAKGSSSQPVMVQ